MGVVALRESSCSTVSSTDAAPQFSSRWATDLVPGIGSMTGDRCSSHARATWDGVAPTVAATASTGPPGRASPPDAIGNQGMKPIERASQCGQHVLRRAVAEVVQVLHAHDGDDRARGLQFRHGDLGEADVADLPFGDQLGEEAELVLGRDLRVDAVELEQVDALESEAPEAHLALLAEVLGSSHRQPLTRTLPCETRLGGDDQPVGIGVEGLEDDRLAHLGPVRVGGVDEVDPEVDCPSDHGHAPGPVGRFAPHARAR